jgi:hypothetical protein
MIHVYNGCTDTVSGTFIIGRELFQPAKMNVTLPATMNVNVQSPLDSNGNLKADIYYPLDSNNRLQVGIYYPLDSNNNLAVDIVGKSQQSNYYNTLVLNNQTITSNGNSSDYDLLSYTNIFVFIYVTAVSGTSPSLNVYLNAVDEANYYQAIPIASVTNITSTGTYYISASNVGFRFANVSWTVSGTSPSFTVTITLHAKW